MGKYSSFKGQLTQFTGEAKYQDRVNAKKDEILQQLSAEGRKLSPANLGQVLIGAKLEKARLETELKEQNLIIEAMNQALVENLEAEAYTQLKLDNGVSLSIKDDVYCSVVDKPAFYAWVKETGQEDLFTVNYQTMSSLTKSLLLEDKPIPPGVGTYFKQTIQVRGMKGLENGEE